MTVLVGRTAADNDVLSLKLGSPRDFWLHVAADSGSHVVVRNPEGLERMPRETEQFAASLAAGYSKARKGGRVAVHVCRCEDDVADDVAGVADLVEAYERAGWRETTRVNIIVCEPRRRAAS